MIKNSTGGFLYKIVYIGERENKEDEHVVPHVFGLSYDPHPAGPNRIS